MANMLPMQMRRAFAEGEMGTRDLADQVMIPTFGPERHRVVEPAGVAMNHPLGKRNLSSLGNAVAHDFIFFQGLTTDAGHRRIQSHRLLQNPVGVASRGR